MRLHEVMLAAPAAAGNVEVAELAYDNRLMGPCSSASPDSRATGDEFAPVAVARGAVALVVERHLPDL